MKEMLKNIGVVLFACACCVLLNCFLIWLGYLGFAISMVLVIFAIAGYLGLTESSISPFNRFLLGGVVAVMYLYTIWYPYIEVIAVAGVAIIVALWLAKDYIITEYTGALLLYFVTWDIAFYIMGDPILDWVDAVLATTALVCSGIWIYHAKTLPA